MSYNWRCFCNPPSNKRTGPGFCTSCGRFPYPAKVQAIRDMGSLLWEWQCPVCENWRTGETCHTCGTSEKESRHHREKR